MAHTRLIDQLVRKSFPHPVAASWHQVALATSDADRIKRLLSCLEVLVRTQCCLVLPDYLRGPRDTAVEKTLPRLDRPALGHWIQLLRSMLKAIRDRDEPAFIPEMVEWYLPKGRPSESAKRLDDLVRLRNAEAHGHNVTGAEQRERALGLLSDLRHLLGDVEFMAVYRPFRILTSKLSRKGGFQGRVQFLTGIEPQAEPIRGRWNAHLFQESVYLSNPAGDAFLEVSPFVQVLHDPGPRAERVFLLACTRKQKKLVLKNDATGTEESRLVHTEDADLSLDTWLEQRGDHFTHQENSEPEHFAVEQDAADEVLDNRFEVQSTLGEGGMATVFLVWDRWDEAEFALKVLHRQLSEESEYRERFRREARTMKRLRHPHILPVEETSELRDGRLYLKLPLVTGGTLKDRIVDGGVPEDRLVDWARQMLEGLDYLHGKGVLHRDIKPSNYLVADDQTLFLADFGIALQGEDTRLTRTLEQLGSLAYMAPERRRGGATGPPSDLYSLGVVLHELMTGEEGATTPGAGLSGAMGALIRELCADDPKDRPTTSEALTALSELAPVKAEAPPQPPAPPPPPAEPVYRCHGPDGQQTLVLSELVARIREDPAVPWLLWQPGWDDWLPYASVTEVAAALESALQPPAVSEVGGVSIDTTEVLPAAFEMEEGYHVVLTRGFEAQTGPVNKALWGAVMDQEGDGEDPLENVSFIEAVQFCIALCEATGLDSPYSFTAYRPKKAYSIDDMGRMLRKFMPLKRAGAVLGVFGRDTLEMMQFSPERLGEVPGIGAKSARSYAAKWDPDAYFIRDVVWNPDAPGYRLPTEAEWVLMDPELDDGCWEWVWDIDDNHRLKPHPAPLPEGEAIDPVGAATGPRRIVRGSGGRTCKLPEHRAVNLGFRVVRTIESEE